MSDTEKQEEFEIENEENIEEISDTASEEEVNFEETQTEDINSDETEDEDKDESEVENDEYTETVDNAVAENTVTTEDAETEFTAEQFEALNKEVESLRAEVQELREFKLQIENQRKQAIIDKYFMLSDEDKKDIVDNMTNYSLEEIEAKLALIYVEQNVDFSKVDGQSDNEPSPSITFSLDEEVSTEQLTDLQRALHATRN